MAGMDIFIVFVVALLAVTLVYRLVVTPRAATARDDVEVEEALAVLREQVRPVLAIIVAEHPEVRGLSDAALRAFCQHTVMADRRFRMLLVDMSPTVEAGVMQELRRLEILPHLIRRHDAPAGAVSGRRPGQAQSCFEAILAPSASD